MSRALHFKDINDPILQKLQNQRTIDERGLGNTNTLPKHKVFAKGVFRASEMNKTEARYAEYLKQKKISGEIADYWFGCIKFKIADKACWYTPDFLVIKPDGLVELHEVKGAKAIFQDDAKVKTKCCASTYPFKLFVVYPKKGGDWEFEAY